MKWNKTAISVFPSIIMALLTIISVFVKELKGLSIISLIVIFPVLFLLQGMLSSITKTNVILSLCISVIVFYILAILYLNSSAYMYGCIYAIIGVLSYNITNLLKKLKK